MGRRHKVFVSYHHANDENHKRIFELRFGNAADVLVRGSVGFGDIDPNLKTETVRQKIRDEYLRDTSVTVALVGTETWQRKHVDWEIASSLRDTKRSPRSGLLGILLPSYKRAHPDGVDRHTVPPRLADNLDSGFATLHFWSNDPEEVQGWLHDAWLRKSRIVPTNRRAHFAKNRTGARWRD